MEQAVLLMTSLCLPWGLIRFRVVQIIVVVWTPAAAVDPIGYPAIFMGNHTFQNYLYCNHDLYKSINGLIQMLLLLNIT